VSRIRDERGFAAPVSVTLAGLLVVVTVLASAMGRLLVDQRRAAAAADLAALAAASAVQLGGHPCEAARTSAESNGARLVRCEVDGERALVESRLTSPTLLGRVVQVRATAHAGPVG
jgi:secretion/DNA translocation related TadE-like protein